MNAISLKEYPFLPYLKEWHRYKSEKFRKKLCPNIRKHHLENIYKLHVNIRDGVTPSDYSDLVKVKTLSASVYTQNKIQGLFTEFTGVEYFNIPGVDYEYFPGAEFDVLVEAVSSLKNLLVINARKFINTDENTNRLSQLLSSNSSLETLNVKRFKYRKFSTNPPLCGKIKHFKSSVETDNKLSELLTWFSRIGTCTSSNLQSIVLGPRQDRPVRHEINLLEIRNVGKTKNLDFSNYTFNSAPIIMGMPGLESLNLKNSNLKEVEISDLPDLRVLDLSDNELTKLSLKNINYLEKLNLANNQLSNTFWPIDSSLVFLDLSNNKIEDVSYLYGSMFSDQAEILNLCSNPLKNPNAFWNLVKYYPQQAPLSIMVNTEKGCENLIN